MCILSYTNNALSILNKFHMCFFLFLNLRSLLKCLFSYGHIQIKLYVPLLCLSVNRWRSQINTRILTPLSQTSIFLNEKNIYRMLETT